MTPGSHDRPPRIVHRHIRLATAVAAWLLASCGLGLAANGDPALFTRSQAYWAAFGPGIGYGGVFVEDVDADGRPEVVFGTGDHLFFVLGFHDGEYHREFTSAPSAGAVSAMDVAQVDSDPQLEIVVARSTPTREVQVYDGRTGELEGSFDSGLTGVSALVVGDVDADGTIEIVISDSDNLYVFALATGELEVVKYGFGGGWLSLGNVDGDAPLEIAIAKDLFAGYVLDGSSFAVQWGDLAGFGPSVLLVDLDGDTHDEILMSEPFRAYDLDNHEFLFNGASAASRMVTGDVDRDGLQEIVCRFSGDFDIHILDGTTGGEKWTLENGTNRAYPMAIGNADEDAAVEILLSVSSSFPDAASYLSVVDGDQRAEEWRSLDVRGPFFGFDSGDVDGDGTVELVVTSDRSGAQSAGRYMLMDTISWDLEFVSEPPTPADYQGLWRARVAPLDADPALEVCIISSLGYTGQLMCFDGLDHSLQWSAAAPDMEPFRALEIADVDGDGDLEVITATLTSVVAYQASDGQLEWQSATFSILGPPLLRVADVDGDLLSEVTVALVGLSGSQLMVLDGQDGSLQLPPVESDATSLETPDRDRDGVAEILIGTRDGTIQTIDPDTGGVIDEGDLGVGPIDALRVLEVAGYKGDVYLVVADNRLRMFDAETLLALLTTDRLAPYGVGEHDSVLARDMDGDGRTEVAVNLDVGFLVLELRPVGVFSDGFESGDTIEWTETVP